MRELGEETGLIGSIGAVLGVHSTWFEAHESIHGRSGHALAVVFEANDPHSELKQNFDDDDTTVDAAWFPIGEVAGLKRVPLVDFALGLVGG